MTTPVRPWFHFFAGALLTGLAVAVVVGVVVYQRGSLPFRHALGLAGTPPPVRIPAGVLAELKQANVIGDNFPGLMPEWDHDNVFVQPDAELSFTLRPNVRLEVVVLPSGGGVNFEPPLLYIPSGTTLPPAARQFVDEHARLRYAYTTDSDGRRLTLPPVTAATKVLIVGDSVAFGVGVGDADTSASQLQAMLGTGVQVVNAGVGEYDAAQALGTADRLSRATKYDALVYIACPNDFGSVGAASDMRFDGDWGTDAAAVLDRLASLADRFDRGITVVLTSLLEYEIRDVFEPAGAQAEFYARTDALRQAVRTSAAAAGFRYADWSDIVAAERQASASQFSPFALYADRVHLSREGNKLLAEKLRTLLSYAQP